MYIFIQALTILTTLMFQEYIKYAREEKRKQRRGGRSVCRICCNFTLKNVFVVLVFFTQPLG